MRPWKLALKTKNSRFLKALNQTVLQYIRKSFEDVHLDEKIYLISSASLWNSTTVITLVHIYFLKAQNVMLLYLHLFVKAYLSSNINTYVHWYVHERKIHVLQMHKKNSSSKNTFMFSWKWKTWISFQCLKRQMVSA